MPAETALERVKRILEMIPYLHGRSERISNLANDFDVPAEVIARDLEIAFMSGLPGYTPDLLIEVSLESGFATVTEPQSLNLPPAMNAGQVVTLFFGINLLLGMMEHEDSTRKVILDLTTRIGLLLGEEPLNDPNSLDFIAERTSLEAIHQKRYLSFDYLPMTVRRSSERKVAPVEIYWRSGQSLLNAIDVESGQPRNFFLSRMSKLRLGEVVGANVASRALESRPSMYAEILLGESALWWTKRFSAFLTEVSFDEQAHTISVTLEFWNEAWLIGTLASVADLVLSVKGVPRYAEKIRKYLEMAG